MSKKGILSYPKKRLFNPLLAQTISAFGVLTLPPLASFILVDLGISAFYMGLMMSSFYLGCIIFSFVTGQIINRLGIQKSMVSSLMIIGVFIMISSFISSIWVMILFLSIAGMGYSLINPTINLLITQDFSKDVRGLAMSIKQMGVTLGGVLTALSLPKLAIMFDWRSALFCGGAIVFCCPFIFYSYLKAVPQTQVVLTKEMYFKT